MVLILHYFDLKSHTQIETNAFGYAIKGVFNQLTSDQSLSGHMIQENPNFCKSSKINKWYPMAFFSR